MEDERLVAVAETGTGELADALERLCQQRQRLVKVLGHHRDATRPARMVPWIGKTRRAFQQDLELEQQFPAVVRQRRDPLVTRLLLLAPQSSAVVQ